MHNSVGLRHDSRESIVPRAPFLRKIVNHEPGLPPPGPARIRVRVEHSIPLTGTGITALLMRSSDFEVAAPDAEVDVLIADLDAGLRALDSGSARHVLIVAQDDGEPSIRAALSRGARGFLLHSCSVEELGAAVRTISRGGTAFAPSVASRIAQSLASDPLTEREHQVLRLMVLGLSDKDMAKQLSIAPGTVKSHMKAILTKLGAARRTEAAAIALRRGIARVF
jgi:DNA-binding NarL/FixJ family response regulator